MIFRIILISIFFSGFSSLGYELCWIRKGALLIGATPQSLSIVVAVFFGGLAVGAYLFGRISKRFSHNLLLYGVLEVSIGLIATATPEIFEHSANIYATVYHWTGTNLILHIFIRSLLVALIIFLPCVLMGGTLPLLCQFYAKSSISKTTYSAGNIYAVNAAGAFAGCIFSGIILIPYYGINTTILLNAILSIAVGGICILLHDNSHLKQSNWHSDSGTSAYVSQKEKRDLTMLSLFFCTGFTALGYEIMWARFLSLIIYNTIYTCVFTLGAVLLGISVGGIITNFIDRCPKRDVLLFASANLLVGLSVVFIVLQPANTWKWIQGTQSLSMQALLCLLIILIPSVVSGISFPLAYRLLCVKPQNAGNDFGLLTAVNTVGGIIGALLVGYYLLPNTGMYFTLIVLTGLSLLIGIVTIFLHSSTIVPKYRNLSILSVLVMYFGIVCFSSTNLPVDFLANKYKVIDYSEGISSFISVTSQNSDKILEIDRMWQGGNQKGHQILAAHIPMILHQDPKRVLVVGMGTGQAASRFLMYDISQLDCVDIEKTLPIVLKRNFNSNWLEDPRTKIINDDGRNFITYTPNKYDVVSIEVGQSFRPQISSFYTVDFYKNVKKRLNKDGLVCQFLPIGFFTEAEFKSLVHSFMDVFPHSTLWFNKYAECLLIGSTSTQQRLSVKRLHLLQSDKIINSDLDYSLDKKPWLLQNNINVFAANFLMGTERLAKFATGNPVYIDDKPILEYQTARNIYSQTRFHDLIEKNMDSPEEIFAHKISISTEAKIIQIREETVHDSLKIGR